MTTFHLFPTRPLSVIKCTKVPSGYRWESFTFQQGQFDSSFAIETYSFRPDKCHDEVVFCTEHDFIKVKEAVLSELNIMLLPAQKVSKTVIEL